jgi:hypothetical protein
MLQSQSEQDHRLLTFLSDGGETVQNLPGSFHPQSVHLLDWFHLAMRVTVLGQYIKGLIRLNQEGRSDRPDEAGECEVVAMARPGGQRLGPPRGLRPAP